MVSQPIGVLPPNEPIQTITSKAALVFVAAVSILLSKNISMTTSASVWSDESFAPFLVTVGSIDQDAVTFKFSRLSRRRGKIFELILIFGNECTLEALSFHIQVTLKTVACGSMFIHCSPEPSAPHALLLTVHHQHKNSRAYLMNSHMYGEYTVEKLSYCPHKIAFGSLELA